MDNYPDFLRSDGMAMGDDAFYQPVMWQEANEGQNQLESLYPETYMRIIPHVMDIALAIGSADNIDDKMIDDMVQEVLARSGYSDDFNQEAVETISNYHGGHRRHRNEHRPGNDFIRTLLLSELLGRNRYYRGPFHPYYRRCDRYGCR